MPDQRNFPDLETARAEWPAVIELLEQDVLRQQRWFQGRDASSIRSRTKDYAFLPWPHPDELASLNIVGLDFDGLSQDYFLPLILLPERPGVPTLAHLSVAGKPFVLAEASLSRRISTALLAELAQSATLTGRDGRFVFHPAASGMVRAVQPLTSDSSNTVLRLHRDEVWKVTRRLWPGQSREVRLGLSLTDRPFIPSIHGHLTYEAADGTTSTLSVWQEFLPNRGSLWDSMVAGLHATLRLSIAPGQTADPGEILTQWLAQIAPDLEGVGLLTANLHAALAAVEGPAPFSAADLAPIVARIRGHLAEAGAKLPQDSPDLWPRARNLAEHLDGRLQTRAEIGQKFQTHGDLHLGQILLTDEGYAVLDLEGEPLIDPELRAAHTTPLRDLAGLVRSFSYVGQAAYLALVAGQRIPPQQEETALFLAGRFAERAATATIKAYGAAITRLAPGLVPDDPVAFMDLLDLCRLEKVAYELAYELANRPPWVVIPLAGLRSLLAERLGAGAGTGRS